MCLCSRCFLWELSHAALGDPAVSATQTMCPRLLHLPPESLSHSKYTKHYFNCLSLPPQHAKNLLGFCQEYLTKSSLRKVARGEKKNRKRLKRQFSFSPPDNYTEFISEKWSPYNKRTTVVVVEVFMAKASGHSLLLLSFSIQGYTQRFDEDSKETSPALYLSHYFSRHFLLIKSIPAPFHPVSYCHVTWYQLWALHVSNPTYQQKEKTWSVWNSPWQTPSQVAIHGFLGMDYFPRLSEIQTI